MKIDKLPSTPRYSDSAPAKLVTAGPVQELTIMNYRPKGAHIRRLDEDYYVNLNTGEQLMYNHGETRADNLGSVRRSLATIRQYINENVTAENSRWVTLTYAENMTDTKRLYEDFHAFWKRFKYWNAKQGYDKPEYISVVEPQARGAWHCHCFFIWPGKAPYIDNNGVLEQLWPHGYTKTKALNNVDNIGAYFSAYLADMPLSDLDKLPEDKRLQLLAAGGGLQRKDLQAPDGSTEQKSFVKGARLVLYPPGMQLVRHSRGIRPPTVERLDYLEAKEKTSGATEVFSRSWSLLLDGDGVPLHLTKKQYNRQRQK